MAVTSRLVKPWRCRKVSLLLLVVVILTTVIVVLHLITHTGTNIPDSQAPHTRTASKHSQKPIKSGHQTHLQQSTVTLTQHQFIISSANNLENDLTNYESHYTIVAPPVYKDVIVRSVYFDKRPRHDHRNASVFMLEVRKTILEQKSIIGCAVGGNFTGTFNIRVPHCMSWLHEAFTYLTHEPVMLDCYDLPGINGSEASIVYEYKNQTLAVRSERPFMIPAPYHPPPNPQKHNFSVATCTAVLYGRPRFLIDWLRYQKTIGIDHVHMIAEYSFEAAGGLKHPYLRQAIEQGYVSVEVWHQWHDRYGMYYHSQPIAHEDCLYRLHSTYDYAFILDQDDFFIPRVSDQQTVQYYIKTFCPHGSCAFEWHEYYPDCGMEGTAHSDGNLTQSLTSPVFKRRSHTKSVHTLSGILDAGPHAALKYIGGYSKPKSIPDDIAYVAHLRIGRKPEKC